LHGEPADALGIPAARKGKKKTGMRKPPGGKKPSPFGRDCAIHGIGPGDGMSSMPSLEGVGGVGLCRDSKKKQP
jgi:hypothetical protein